MYYLYPSYYSPVYLQSYPPIYYPRLSPAEQYPPIETAIFSKSVKAFKNLLKQGELLIDQFADTTFANKMMDAAQKGEQKEVDRLIQSIQGLTAPVKVRYTPSGVLIDITAPHKGEGGNCCTLTITLKWRA